MVSLEILMLDEGVVLEAHFKYVGKQLGKGECGLGFK